MNQFLNSCLTFLNNIGRGFCDYGTGIFIQSGILIILLLITDLLIRKRVRAIFRYWIWMLVFVKLMLPPAFSFPTGLGHWFGDYLPAEPSISKQVSNIVRQEPARAPVPEESALPAEIKQIHRSRANPGPAAPEPPAFSDFQPLTWQAVVFIFWLAGTAILSGFLIYRMLFVRRLIAQSEPAKDRFAEILDQCRQQLDIKCKTELRLSGKLMSPAVCGLCRPVILMPAGLIEGLSPDKLKTILIHEMAHIKRGDLWVNSIQTCLQIIYFYNPFVWLANAFVRRIREQAVDEMVIVTLGAGAKSYSNTLIDISEMAFFRTSLSLRLIGVVESKKALYWRIRHMLNRPVPKNAKLGTLGLVIIIITGAVLLPMAKAKNKGDVNFAANLSGGETSELTKMEVDKLSVSENSPSERKQSAELNKVDDPQKLIDSAQPGATVIVPKGLYTNPVRISKSLTLKGESQSDCVFEVTANEPAVFIDTKGKGQVTVENLTIKWQLATSDKNIEHPFALGVKDSKVEVKNCSFVPLGNSRRSPVAVRGNGFTELNISKCRFEGFEYVICYGEGIKGKTSDSLIMNCGHQGIINYTGSTLTVERNVITGSKFHAVRCTGGTLHVKDNLLIKNANRGIYLGNKSGSGSITNNLIIDNATGIGAFARAKYEIKNNVISDSSYAGIGMEKSCYLTIQDNIFANNQRGWVMFDRGTRGGNTCRRNTFWKNKVDAENFRKTGNSITNNPDFTDPANGDYSLKPGPAMENKQGLTNPGIFKELWKVWKNRENKQLYPVKFN